MWFWIVLGIAISINWGGLLASSKLRSDGYIICREEKLSDFWTTVVSDVMLLLDFIAVQSWFAVVLVGIYWFGIRFSWRMYLRHSDHEEDCIYGPRRKRMTVGTKLKMLWKPRVLVAPA